MQCGREIHMIQMQKLQRSQSRELTRDRTRISIETQVQRNETGQSSECLPSNRSIGKLCIGKIQVFYNNNISWSKGEESYECYCTIMTTHLWTNLLLPRSVNRFRNVGIPGYSMEVVPKWSATNLVMCCIH
mmetsp:Transcript_11638/g.26917  ORF Transcript_11638/g.26917 Transcript_11638/m.26917 type:complete len:131 (-) Transcript_11638:576-968(-)